jgi:hypothetical protein
MEVKNTLFYKINMNQREQRDRCELHIFKTVLPPRLPRVKFILKQEEMLSVQKSVSNGANHIPDKRKIKENIPRRPKFRLKYNPNIPATQPNPPSFRPSHLCPSILLHFSYG